MIKADGKPGGARTTVQYNSAGAFGGDAGLTYSDRQLVVSGDADKSTPLLLARSGDFRASAIAETFVPNADVLYTAVDPGPDGNDITIAYTTLGASTPISIDVTGTAITVYLAADSGNNLISTASDVIAAVNGDVTASALVTATLAPGNDGTGLAAFVSPVAFSGGALAADSAWIDARGVLNIQLQTGLGLNAINVRDTAGDVVAHIDNDGGVVFSSGRFSLSQNGTMAVDTLEASLTGNATLRYSINGYGMFVIAAGGGYAFSVNNLVPTDIAFNVAAYTGQTGDLFVAFNENYEKVFRVLPNGEVQIDKPDLGIILIDRTTATRYRLYVDNGVFGIEAV